MNKFMGVFVNVTIWLSLDNTPFPICTQTQPTAYVKYYFAQRNRSNGNFRLHLCRRNLDSFGVISSSINYLCTSLERCPSGRRSTPGKCVYAKSVSRVRIPSSLQQTLFLPLFSPNSSEFGVFYAFLDLKSTHIR